MSKLNSEIKLVLEFEGIKVGSFFTHESSSMLRCITSLVDHIDGVNVKHSVLTLNYSEFRIVNYDFTIRSLDEAKQVKSASKEVVLGEMLKNPMIQSFFNSWFLQSND